MMSRRDASMARESGTLDEVLARVLDRGIVIDSDVKLDIAWLRLAGLDARFVIASVDTPLERSDSDWIGGQPPHPPFRDIGWRGQALESGDAASRRSFLRALSDENVDD